MIFSGWIWFSMIAVLRASSVAATTISRTGACTFMRRSHSAAADIDGRSVTESPMRVATPMP